MSLIISRMRFSAAARSPAIDCDALVLARCRALSISVRSAVHDDSGVSVCPAVRITTRSPGRRDLPRKSRSASTELLRVDNVALVTSKTTAMRRGIAAVLPVPENAVMACLTFRVTASKSSRPSVETRLPLPSVTTTENDFGSSCAHASDEQRTTRHASARGMIGSLRRLRHEGLERLHDFRIRHGRPAALSIHPHVLAESGGVQALAAAIAQLVAECHSAAGRLADEGTNQNFVVIVIRSAVTAIDLRDHHDQSTALDLLVCEAGGAAQVRAADLEPDDVICMMGDAHLIGLLIPHARPAIDEARHGGNLARGHFCFRTQQCREWGASGNLRCR